MGTPGSRDSAPPPQRLVKAQVETRRRHPRTQQSPRPPARPGLGSADFSAAARLVRPHACALTSLTPASGARPSARRNRPTQSKRETRQKKRQPATLVKKKKKKQASPLHTRARLPPAGSRDAHGPDLARGQPPGHRRRRPAPGRLLCVAGRSGRGPRAVTASARQVFRAARRASAARTLACRRRALCTSGSRGGGNRLVTS